VHAAELSRHERAQSNNKEQKSNQAHALGATVRPSREVKEGGWGQEVAASQARLYAGRTCEFPEGTQIVVCESSRL
jgi:hypothetical protein